MTSFTSTPAAEIVAGLTLEEKASLTSGGSFWTTKTVERAGIPAIVLTDGPHGVRLQPGHADNLGLSESIPATCFPPAVALGSTFDPELLTRIGEALGDEAQAEGVGVLLGPGINIKRSPLCGRNFEYLSEDPLVSGALGAALVRGIQSRGVGASVKHFAANNQEEARMQVSVDIAPRPLREIYLRGFQRIVEDAQPWTLMCSYNKINGVYASEDPWLLSHVLRGDWGFDGIVMSDWGAVNNRVVGLPAGLDLEMPTSDGRTDAELVAAVHSGELDEAAVTLAATRMVELVQKAVAGAKPGASYDRDEHHALARDAAARGVVLLKNDGGLLPVTPGRSLAVIGEFARTPRYQGAGSSQINPTKLDNALAEIEALAGADQVRFAAGFTLQHRDQPADAALLAEAVSVASAAETVLLFLGLPNAAESEGFDRKHIRLPAEQLEVLAAVCAANQNTVVVLSNGSVVELPFTDDVPAIVEGWLGGQAGGGGIADVLFGVVNPSGRLAETIPLRLEDTPAYLNFPGELGHVVYGEGVFVGYRWYDARDTAVRYAFGHGLSYTSFTYSELSVSTSDAGLSVRVNVTNTGDRAGREVVQAYTSINASKVARAPRELTGFANVSLAAGESREVTIEIGFSDLAYWSTRLDGWVVEGGTYTVEVGASSRDIRASASVVLAGNETPAPITLESSLGELKAHPIAGPIIMQAMGQFSEETGANAILEEDGMEQLMSSFPIGRLASFPSVPITMEQIEQLIELANAPR